MEEKKKEGGVLRETNREDGEFAHADDIQKSYEDHGNYEDHGVADDEDGQAGTRGMTTTTTTTMVSRERKTRTENRETVMPRRADGDDDDDEEEEASGQLLSSGRQNLPLLFLELHSQNCRGPSRAKTKIPPI